MNRTGFWNKGMNSSGLTRAQLLELLDRYRDVEPTHYMKFEGLDKLALYQRGMNFRFTMVDLVDTTPRRNQLDDEWISYIQQAPFSNKTLSDMFGISVHMVRKYQRTAGEETQSQTPTAGRLDTGDANQVPE